MAAGTSNKGNGKGPILGLNNKPISESDRVKYKAVDAAQTKMLKASNAKTAKPAAIKEAVAGKVAAKKTGAKNTVAKMGATPAAKPVAKKVASRAKGKRE
jgi:hypothetical protein